MKSLLLVCSLLIVSSLLSEVEGRRRRCDHVEECTGKKVWNRRKCACDCPKESKCFPIDAIFDPDTCNWCMPCPANEKIDFATCKCGGCKAPSVIPEDKKWDDVNCKLICKDPMPDNIDDLHKWNDQTCAVECKTPMPDNIDDLHQWNKETCAVECKTPKPDNIDDLHEWNNQTCAVQCITVTSCPGRQAFNESFCGCECPYPRVEVDTESQHWDDLECDALCNWDPYPCSYEGHVWNKRTCNCTCADEVVAALTPTCLGHDFFSPKRGCKCVSPCEAPEGLDVDNGCPPDFYYCGETCQCECLEETVPKYCGADKTWNNQTCECECRNPIDDYVCSRQQSAWTYDWNTCSCGCPYEYFQTDEECQADNPYEIFNKNTCRCACPNESDKNSCPRSHTTLRWNADICKCECKDKGEEEFCNDPLLHKGFNEKTCVCDCINSAPAGGCDEFLPGSAWNRTTCECYLCKECRHITPAPIG